MLVIERCIIRVYFLITKRDLVLTVIFCKQILIYVSCVVSFNRLYLRINNTFIPKMCISNIFLFSHHLTVQSMCCIIFEIQNDFILVLTDKQTFGFQQFSLKSQVYTSTYFFVFGKVFISMKSSCIFDTLALQERLGWFCVLILIQTALLSITL